MATKKQPKNIATVRVKTELEKPIDVDLVAEHIRAVAENFERALKSGLNRRAIIVLIHDSIPRSSKITQTDIGTILEYAPRIKNFLTK